MARSAKEKRCRVCGNEYYPYSSLSVACSPACAMDYVQGSREKAAIKRQREEKKAIQRDTRKRKEKLKSRSDHLKDTQPVCNKYIRIRDSGDGCISCDKPADWLGQWHASHYRPVGNNSRLRFHHFNIHKSCSECNNHKSGNLTEYREKLILKIGLENVEWLESQNEPYTWDVEDLKEIQQYFKELTKEIIDET